ncbi:apiosidase-like domain-containing protein [Lactobacillus mulieris]|uniref:DUF4038 domain-containing protein n=1 Tax=Lactobacillus mulieris TaxID=2508708 RepID=A0AAW5WYN4_9LACO|nr:DUF4038 domain-containing protein [Lactobacillus mulieris]MCZ3621687.1 DUF4038 domain-containing protein [Lactobacillus mulieris]MCZ3623037.1 DUF4038 domain-containing protein [Lactobacillus mulieris]MCZ3635694.1 DUF4038 domain-containing protein [Lactobacillus mulieris]MCZ3690093.1 DUF4038 domain-containing protein [Lactobacillus mulieris]MCZ3696031.1 DUF4038 domain-containing protein [Lactobacillus mulieris]
MLTVNGKYLYKDGQRFFYLADTCWSAFTNLTLPDWKFYLDTRKAQGYTAIQINLLRQYDSSCPIKGREPFAVVEHDDGSYEYDFSKINTSYFDNVEKMLEQMKERDMVPSLVLLWGNFVPDTWMSHFVKNNTIPFEQIKPYVQYIVNRFKKFNPIWFISGDVGFVDNENQKSGPAIKYYREVLESAKEVDPEGIYTFHINGESYELPDELKKQISFFSYQSGHAQTGQNTAFTIPQKLRESGYEGPIVDAEICYEGLQKVHSQYPERYSAFEVRKAAWRAVLAGADMGVGYGALGLWPLKDNSRPESKLAKLLPFKLMPYDWRQCLQFRGANDMGFLKNIVLKYAPNGLRPIEKVIDEKSGIVAAENDNYKFIYSPMAQDLELNGLANHAQSVKIIDLKNRTFVEAKIKEDTLVMPFVLEDMLVIIEAEKKNG